MKTSRTDAGSRRPVPRCPPRFPIGKPGNYGQQLNHLPTPKLKTELEKQKQALFVAQHGKRYDPVAERRALNRIDLINRELVSRGVSDNGYHRDAFQAA